MKFYLIILLSFFLLLSNLTFAQESGNFYEGENIHAVIYRFTNPVSDSLIQRSIQSKVERVFPVFPNSTIRSILLDAYTSKVKQLPEVADASYEIRSSQTGGIDIFLTITLQDKIKEEPEKTGVFSNKKGFPLLYMDNKSLLTMKVNIAEMLYSNNNAWYGRDDVMLAGNPLVKNPAGKGYTGWVEGWVSAGLYGITTLSAKKNIYLYGGSSFILSGSAGQELFTDKSRIHGAFEDAFIGLLGTRTGKNGDRFTYNFSAGRQQFSIGQGFILRNTASNGGDRGALQLNPRWAADFLGLASLKYNNLLFQFFQVDPDELPIIDGKTIIRGFNAEWGVPFADKIGISILNVPKSNSNYYTPSGGVLGKKGLWVYNLRYYSNLPPGNTGLIYKTELAFQRNANYKMSAWAGYGELGWSFARSKGAPVITYRFAYFSGDNPATQRFERWDPILSGGNGEEWVLGANHFKIVQNSNVIVNKLQANIRPSNRFELVPQVLLFLANQNNNIGGNPALSYMPMKSFAKEINLSWKYFHSRNWYFHGHFAQTIPGKGSKEALGNNSLSWFSAMVFFRYSIF